MKNNVPIITHENRNIYSKNTKNYGYIRKNILDLIIDGIQTRDKIKENIKWDENKSDEGKKTSFKRTINDLIDQKIIAPLEILFPKEGRKKIKYGLTESGIKKYSEDYGLNNENIAKICFNFFHNDYQYIEVKKEKEKSSQKSIKITKSIDELFYDYEKETLKVDRNFILNSKYKRRLNSFSVFCDVTKINDEDSYKKFVFYMNEMEKILEKFLKKQEVNIFEFKNTNKTCFERLKKSNVIEIRKYPKKETIVLDLAGVILLLKYYSLSLKQSIFNTGYYFERKQISSKEIRKIKIKINKLVKTHREVLPEIFGDWDTIQKLMISKERKIQIPLEEVIDILVEFYIPKKDYKTATNKQRDYDYFWSDPRRKQIKLLRDNENETIGKLHSLKFELAWYFDGKMDEEVNEDKVNWDDETRIVMKCNFYKILDLYFNEQGKTNTDSTLPITVKKFMQKHHEFARKIHELSYFLNYSKLSFDKTKQRSMLDGFIKNLKESITFEFLCLLENKILEKEWNEFIHNNIELKNIWIKFHSHLLNVNDQDESYLKQKIGTGGELIE